MTLNTTQADERVTVAIQKRHLYMGVGILIGFGFGYAAAIGITLRNAPSGDGPSLPSFEELTYVEVSTEERPSRGPEGAPVTILEFTDYECPFCRQHFLQTYAPLLSQFDGQLRYVVRNFPIQQIHPRAQQAAEAAECANEQGKFWEYHDLMFDRAPALDRSNLSAYAIEIGLDVVRFEACVDSGAMAPVVAQDFEDGIQYGVRATPTFFINGRMVSGALSLDEFGSYVQEAMTESTSGRR